MNEQNNDENSSSFFAKKESELLAMKRQLEELAGKLFPLAPLEPLPPWANPQEIEEKKKTIQTQMKTMQQQTQQAMAQQVTDRKTVFQEQRTEMAKKEAQIRKASEELTPPDAFGQEKKIIEAQTHLVNSEFQRIQGLIAKVEQLFKKGDQ